jgi:hypothetical protein
MLSALKLALIAGILLTGNLFTKPVYAGDFGQVFIRLDRIQVSASTGGLVCATAETAGTESKVEITFPSGFDVNSTLANWTVSTSDLPSGASSWPGIGSASSISGQTVTFPSSDLVLGNLYCFSFSATNTLINGSSPSNSNLAVVTSRSASNSIIDEKQISFSTQASDQITISARVGAGARDFTTQTGNISQKEKYSQNETIQYEITYGSFLPYSTSFILEADWSLGSIDDPEFPSVDLLEYVVGSASTGYENTPAVVDLANRKIRWYINNFPANTINKTVYFNLRTRGAYTGPKDVHFQTASKIIYEAENVVTASSIKSDIFRYDFNPPPSPNPTPLANNAPPRQITLPVFEKIEIREITSSSISLFVDLSLRSNITIKYGNSINKLTSTLKSSSPNFEHNIKLDGLVPDTYYFFKLEVLNEQGKIVSSDIFTFKTAKTSELSNIDPQSLVLTSSQVIIYSPTSSNLGTNPFVVVPSENILEFKFSIKNPGSVTQIITVQRLAQVLGITTFTMGVEANADLTSAMEIGDGSFFSRLRVPKETGFYEVSAKIFDTSGNLTETPLFKLKVVEPLKVLNSKDTPIENAKAYIYLYNPRKKLYELISPQAINIQNPLLTTSKGIIEAVLPKGDYKVEVLALGYKEKKVNFRIGEGKNEGYPEIVLENDIYGIGTAIKYYSSTALDIFHSTSIFLQQLSTSIRFFDFLLFLLIGILVYLTLVSFTLRTHISPLFLPHFLLYEIKRLFKKDKSNEYVSGKIFDQEDKSPIGQVSLFILNERIHQIAGEIKTNSKGEFIFKKPKYSFSLMAVKKGYELLEDIYFSDEDIGHIKIGLIKKEDIEGSIFKNLKYLSSNLTGLSFEVLIFLSFVFEILFIFTFGIFKALPLLIISLINLFIWIRFLHRHKNLV